MKSKSAQLFLMIWLVAPTIAGADKLSETASSVGGSGSRSSSGDDDSCIILCAVLEVIFDSMWEDDDPVDTPAEPARQPRFRFAPYPYAAGHTGYKVTEPDSKISGGEIIVDGSIQISSERWAEPFQQTERWSLRTGSDYQYDLDAVHLVSAYVKLKNGFGYGFDFRWTEFFERLDGEIDTLSLLQAGLSWDFVPHTIFGIELSAVLLGMSYDGNLFPGAALRIGFDIMPLRPLIISGQVIAGGLNEATYLHSRGTLGVAIRQLELYAGYDIRIFDGDTPITYHGPVAGIRLWF